MQYDFHIDLRNYEGPEKATSYFIEYWYNRSDRYWVIAVIDNLDREVECRTAGNKADALSVAKEAATDYNTKDIRKL